jgi:hypothetical protein
MSAGEYTEPEKDNPNLLNPNSENGFDYGAYNFSQVLGSLDVYVPLKAGIRSRDVDVKITGGSLKVGLKGETPVIDGKLHDKVKPDDCTWTLIDNKVVHVYLEKHDGMKWWSCVIVYQRTPNCQISMVTSDRQSRR